MIDHRRAEDLMALLLALPKYVLVRDTSRGQETALTTSPDAPGQMTLLLFSSKGRARPFLRGWQIGKLETREEYLRFLRDKHQRGVADVVLDFLPPDDPALPTGAEACTQLDYLIHRLSGEGPQPRPMHAPHI